MKWLRWPAILVPVLVLVLAGALTWALWPEPHAAPKPRERHYEEFTGCLLTDDKGLAGDQARAAWDGMQAASAAHLIKVQYLAVEGPQTSANALAYFNSLALQGCRVLVAVGEAPVAALVQGKSRFPGCLYVAVASGPAAPGVRGVDPATGDGIRVGVQTALGSAWLEADTK